MMVRRLRLERKKEVVLPGRLCLDYLEGMNLLVGTRRMNYVGL